MCEISLISPPVGMTLYVSEHVDEVVSQGQELGRSRPDDYLDEPPPRARGVLAPGEPSRALPLRGARRGHASPAPA